MPGKKYRSIQNPEMYRALRREGKSKESAARISNARTPGHHVARKAQRKTRRRATDPARTPAG